MNQGSPNGSDDLRIHYGMNNNLAKFINAENDFTAVSLKVASPERILEWSNGEVTKPETINYRTQRSEKSGLFDEKIFGPEKDYECYCGKYKGIRYKGIICEKCGVELTRSVVRRERMGHIDLATPVAHIWFLRSLPSRLGLIMGMSAAELEKVIYFAGYIVTKVYEDEKARLLKDLDSEFKAKVKGAGDERTKDALKEKLIEAKKEIEEIREGLVLDEIQFHSYSIKYSTLFEAGIGAEAVYNICRVIDLNKLLSSLEEAYVSAGAGEREKLNKRLSLVRSLVASNQRPEWMFLSRVPVIPPGLRPMVPLDGGRFATSDVNDLYRRVINRNNRLKKLKEIGAPDVILRNEKRILQEAVDALIDSSIRHGSSSAGALTAAQRRELKSLSDNLKGKRGLFRQNLLGKRVDYSGRSVIVVGPHLHLDQCGLPKHMALELFRPFVISKLVMRELAFNIRGANKLIDEGIPEVWEILEEVIANKYVLLNRAPTLHRLGIQAFRPTLVEGNAIHVHPLVCTAFNADFDGDQMAVHVPLGAEAQLEAKEIMASNKNVLKPGSGNVVVSIDKLDIILGCYWMTKIVAGSKGEGLIFPSPNHAITVYDYGVVDFRALIKVLPTNKQKYDEFKGELFETSVGRLLFNSVLPSDYPYLNKEMDRKKMGGLIDDLIERYGLDNIPAMLDKIKTFGFKYATVSGVTWGIDDVKVPAGKFPIINKAKIEAAKVDTQFNEGLLSPEERLRKHIEIWHGTKGEIEKIIPESLDKNGSVYDLVYSGARGSFSQITQMIGMKGLIQNTAGETIEFPIISSMKEGLTPIEYFITTHGSRKGLTDTALNTAKAGYLTRKLFVVAQDLVIGESDCGTKEGLFISKSSASGIETPLAKNIKGRVLADDVLDEKGTVIFNRGHLVSKRDAVAIESAGVKTVKVRSPLTCRSVVGVCANCYGYDLGKNNLVGLGEAVGTVAAQAIGEPGTQLTMRTFHAGGTASVGGDITQGLPRVEELFEKRKPKNPAIIAHVDGVITEIKVDGNERVLYLLPELEHKAKSKKKSDTEYRVAYNRTPLVKVGDKVKKGDLMTDGSADVDELFEYAGRDKTLEYIVKEVSKPYELQGESVSRKHIEVILRQMFSRRKVLSPGGTTLTSGEVIDQFTLEIENAEAKEQNLEPAKTEAVVMGISEVSLSRKSFLSAASFQHTTRVLVAAAVRGSRDLLKGLMENVIIGRLIPAGTGFAGGPKAKMIEDSMPKVIPDLIDESGAADLVQKTD
ncbi:MAG: DNA-directed RNA polymerase subunit beta' [Candidatus Taylorbacteria bacterium RIFCSPLOWO2_02_FULL_43_11]|uniref:DNA-directed RNA polymerase subunit beta' n=1 Tax=Candidatus Taylorbacteria bacterium RIFCSPHIGHO2_02_FULL_43_32b TaxID=1802306 RepID=A0A1G2MKQ7_9BACT|nr:MAG: DNA-directed RNA polymerase subunit beta' [Candidatus Taylorbacteria bacterium RIFCSPHIGHO2_01_FULL_43_47]OHA24314.1 MAG: DNA-directed RNA polymerase subunit beta' [Candidatus Taylorbacteria bacterium RIFCSPHIGHO2_02_FULL_43_32b]OHA37849.1 MAG: DNA-directed RNA polymerase subunit beta' [Candidatus Taylorbacteria bacterium RIFCSPLOWO2_02_FULL_43_11]